jgi:hypothetical protein
MASAVGVIVHAWLSPQFDGKLGELGSTAQEPEETVKEVSCASAMLTIMTRKMIRASRGTEPTPQRRHGSGVTNAYAMFCSEGHPTLRLTPDASDIVQNRASCRDDAYGRLPPEENSTFRKL